MIKIFRAETPCSATKKIAANTTSKRTRDSFLESDEFEETGPG